MTIATPRECLVLGIESSCDETAAAVVRCDSCGTLVLSNVIASQHELHAEYRGVVPEIASRAHAERLLPVVRDALAQADVNLSHLGAIAVGHRPGLIGCLLVGVAGAKALAWSLGVPIVAVDHVQAHLYAACLNTTASIEQSTNPDPGCHAGFQAQQIASARSLQHQASPVLHRTPAFPAIGLVVSGGHTSLYRCESPTRVAQLGHTIDDAVGEAYDKVAAILGLPFPGGPNVDRLAATGDPQAIDLPISRLSQDSLDFSFSGLKTAALYAFKGVPPHASRVGKPPKLNKPPARTYSKEDIAASFQRAAVDALLFKIRRALDLHPDCRTLLVGGGVSANSRLRAELISLAREQEAQRLDVRLPSMEFCLDNAAMIAGLGWHVLKDRRWTGDPLSFPASPMSAV
ncbi:MAG: tRNA (adenosine(37)-N6)-threonylcarbamoyltransferase complex transferase subunit TsaD [Pyrinomonadaceae bacterium]|nr:tRNA (adenosine(37)-N6)-threonylcarbamoyltransferase complex transferase subunit TsaD [Phycisphaerales bacterium]